MAKKEVDLKAIASVADDIVDGADLVEQGMVQAKLKKQEEMFKTSRRARLRDRKIYRSFSLSLEENQYFEFIDYLDKNNIDSASKLIRDLLIREGVLKES